MANEILLQESTEGLTFAPSPDGVGYVLTGLGKCKAPEIVLGVYQGRPVVGIAKCALKGAKITSITLPQTIKIIGKGAFAKCSKLERVCISSLAAWCDIWFEDADANPLYYAQNLFINGVASSHISIPEGVKEIKDRVFFRFSMLTQISLPSSLEKIGKAAFSGCIGLSGLSLPNGILKIDDEAFSGCTGIEGEVRLPANLRFLGNLAFEGCKKMQSVVLFPALVELGKGAFHHCDSLTRAHFYGAEEVWNATMKDQKKIFPSYTLITQDNKGVDIVLDEDKNVDYVTEYGQTMTTLMIPEGTHKIKEFAFFGCCQLTAITIPESVTIIEDGAFMNCESLSSITLPAGLKHIGESAFSNCKSLSSITLPDSIPTIEAHTFSGCQNLSAVTLPAGLTRIENGAFTDCKGLSSITLPASLTHIEDNAFMDCKSLFSIALPAGLTHIGDGAFLDCAMTAVVFEQPNGWSVFDNEPFPAKTLSDPAAAAEALKKGYSCTVWVRK